MLPEIKDLYEIPTNSSCDLDVGAPCLNVVASSPFLPDQSLVSRDRLVVRTLRCGRSNPGSNPGHGNQLHLFSLSNR